MRFTVLKLAFGELCGGEVRHDDIDTILGDLYDHRGWPTREALHESVRAWASWVRPGGIFTTRTSAIVAIPPDGTRRDAGEPCPACGTSGLHYSPIRPKEGGIIEQAVTCPECDERWVDVFGIIDRKRPDRA